MRAVITGSTRGLGEAIARDLAARGATVTVNGTNAARCHALAAELGARAVVGSVADEATAEALMADGVDLLVNNAGVTRDGMLTRMTAEQFDEVVAVHLRGSFLTSRAAANAMRETGGAIVNVVSGAALFGGIGQNNYIAAKGGMLALTRALSLELRRYGIRVNALAPVVRTEMIDPLFAVADGKVDLDPYFNPPEQVAPIVAALAAADVTGQVLGFDGTRLTVWSHPTILRREERDGWTPQDIAEALDGTLAELQPDELGAAVLGLMGINTEAKVP